MRAVNFILLLFFIYSQVGCSGCYFFVKIENLDQPTQSNSSTNDNQNNGSDGSGNGNGSGNNGGSGGQVSAPAPATSIIATGRSTYVDLSWSNTSTPLYYTISYGTLTGQTNIDLNTPIFQNYITVEGLAEQTNYFLKIKAHFDNNLILDSDEISFSTTAFTCADFLTYPNLNLKGEGTESSPYMICNSYQLKTLSLTALTTSTSYLSKVFQLGGDIDMTPVTNDFNPIGTDTSPFTGYFIGNDYTIKNWSVTSATLVLNYGLFGYTEGAKLRNLKLDNINFNFNGGGQYIGSIVGKGFYNTKIETINLTNSTINVAISSGTAAVIGGLAGWLNGGVISLTIGSSVMISGRSVIGSAVGVLEGAYTKSGILYQGHMIDVNSSAEIFGDWSLGGIVGYSMETMIKKIFYNVSFDGKIQPIQGAFSMTTIGGLIGNAEATVISHSNFNGLIVGNSRIGGIIGRSESADNPNYIDRTISSGIIQGDQILGGLVGSSSMQGTKIYNSMSKSNITGGSFIGGLIGDSANDNIELSYYNGTIAGTSTLIYSGGLIGKSSSTTVTIDSYANPQFVNFGSLVGGLLGLNFSAGILTTTRTYWDKDSSGVTNFCGGTIGSNCNDAGRLALGLNSTTLKSPSAMYALTSNNANWSFYGENDAPYTVPNDFWIQDATTQYPDLFWHGYDPIADSPFGAGNGSGTEDDPYLIDHPDDFNLISQNIELLTKHYHVTQEINMSNITNTFQPWGDFLGTLDGKYESSPGNFIKRTIGNLTINSPSSDNIGFISGSPSQKISTLVAPVTSLVGKHYLAGTIKNFWVTFIMVGRNFVGQFSGSSSANYILDNILTSGGLVSTTGSIIGGLAARCTFARQIILSGSTVNGTGDIVGGVCGQASGYNYLVSVDPVGGRNKVGGFFGQLGNIPGSTLEFYNSSQVLKSSGATWSPSGPIGIIATGTGVGSIAGEIYNRIVTGSSKFIFPDSKVRGVSQVGGLIGSMYDSQLEYSYIKKMAQSGVLAIGSGQQIGGLVGYVGTTHSTSSDFENKISYMTITGGSVTGGTSGNAVGGLVGEVARDARLTIENSGFEGFVNTSGSLVGGLVGYFSNQGAVTTATNKVINSYSMAKLIGSAKFSGGAVGVIENSNLVSLEKIYYGETNSCTGSNKAGFVSVNNSPSTYMSSNFWDITKNAALNDLSTGSVGDVLKVRSESTTNLNAQSTFTTLGSWDFVNTWVISGTINSGYPTLKNTAY